MDKYAVLLHIRKLKGMSTLLGGELPLSVINSNKYIPQTTDAQATEGNTEETSPSLQDSAILSALRGDYKSAVLVGSEGSGKSTTLQKLVLNWALGQQLDNFKYVFHFRFRELKHVDETLSLETLLLHHHGLIESGSLPSVLQNPEEVLFVFDDLDQCVESLDPSTQTLCSSPHKTVPLPCLVTSLLHGSLMKKAAFVVATKPVGGLKFLNGTHVKILGFLKPQREAFFKVFFTDSGAATAALQHMEKTLGGYDVSTSPRFCWSVCSIYKSLMDAEEKLPETLSQLCASILVHLIQMLSLSQDLTRQLVLALGRMASHCLIKQRSSCDKEETDTFGFQHLLTSVGAFLQVDSEQSGRPFFSFRSQVVQEFLLALSFFLDESTSERAEKMLEKHSGVKYLDGFLSALSEPAQRRPLETLLGNFNSNQIRDFQTWFKSHSEKTLKGFHKERHHRYFRLLHQAQNESLVREIVTPSARLGLSYADLSLQECVALNYVVMCLGDMELLNLYNSGVTDEQAERLAQSMSISKEINLTSCRLSSGAVSHLASALSNGRTKELNLSSSRLGDEKLKILCAGLKDSKLNRLTLEVCSLTEACCEDLASALIVGTPRLSVLNLRANEIGDQGFVALCKALQSPLCKLQDLLVHTTELTAASMEALAAACCSGHSELRKVDLTLNSVCDSGVEVLCKAVKHPLSKLQSLNFFDCELTAACCPALVEAITSEHCSLSELDLSVNDLGQEGALLLCQALSRPGCPVTNLGLTRCELTEEVFRELGSVLKSGTSKLKSLSLGLNKVGDNGVNHLWAAVAHPSCLLEDLDVEMTGLTDACVDGLCAAVRASRTLKSLVLSNNKLTDASVPALVQVMQENTNMVEMDLKYNDFSEDVFDLLEECERIRY